jgi:hypothetical protein
MGAATQHELMTKVPIKFGQSAPNIVVMPAGGRRLFVGTGPTGVEIRQRGPPRKKRLNGLPGAMWSFEVSRAIRVAIIPRSAQGTSIIAKLATPRCR